MRDLRREDLSFNHYLKNNVFQDFIESESNVSLSYLSEESVIGSSYVYQSQSNMDPSPISRGRGWVYLDNPSDTTEQTSSGTLTVYNNSYAAIDPSNYNVDYVDGRIICASTAIVPAYVSYKWYYISIVNEWQVVDEVSELPIVVVEISKFHKEGFQLGGGKYVSRSIDVNIFASNNAERDDITEVLYNGLYRKSCAYQIFPKGTMIDFDGTWNTNYEYATVSGSNNIKFGNVTATTVRVATAPSVDVNILSDINRYRSRVSFDMFYWKES